MWVIPWKPREYLGETESTSSAPGLHDALEVVQLGRTKHDSLLPHHHPLGFLECGLAFLSYLTFIWSLPESFNSTVTSARGGGGGVVFVLAVYSSWNSLIWLQNCLAIQISTEMIALSERNFQIIQTKANFHCHLLSHFLNLASLWCLSEPEMYTNGFNICSCIYFLSELFRI